MTKDLDVQIILGRPTILAGRIVDDSGESVNNAQVSISVMTMAGTLNEGNPQGMQLQFNAGRKDIEFKLPVEAKIEGMVVEKDTGKPVVGVNLVVFNERHQIFSGREPVISRKDGTFSIGALCPGKQIVRAVSMLRGLFDWVTQSVEVTVEAGRTIKGLKVELSRGGVVEVSVTELGDDTPIAGASVYIRNTVSKERIGGGTDNDGILRKRLAPGEYQITRVYKHDYPYERQEQTFTVEGGKTRRVAVQLKGYPKLTGTVRDQMGRPVAGAMIKICPGRDDATSSSRGRFEIRWQTPEWSRMAPHIIARHIERNLAAAVEIEEDVRLIDINMTAGVILTGKVIDVDGEPVEKAYINLTFRSPNYGTSMKREKGVTNAEGCYEIRAVPQNREYSVNAGADGYGLNEVRITTDDAVNNRLEVKPISLAPANLSVSGIVVNVEDKPMDDAHVFIQGIGQPYRNTLTDKDGKFTIEGVCAGNIRITANKPGASVLSGNFQTVGGANNVRIVVNERSSGSLPKQPPLLIGKPLPDLDGLEIEHAPADTENKTMLICFWDMQQRPSRNCVQQLSKRAKELKAKGVDVVVVQASKVDNKLLNEWVKENNIPFPVGMIQDDEEKTRFSWGVKSLPWLILTGREHVVIAEGFGLDDLDDKIRQTGGGK